MRLLRVCLLVCVAGATAHPQAPAQNPPTLPEASVETQQAAFKQRVAVFVQGMTKNPGFGDEQSLVRWRASMCFLAVGFNEKDGDAVSARLAQQLQGVPAGRTSSSSRVPIPTACSPLGIAKIVSFSGTLRFRKSLVF